MTSPGNGHVNWAAFLSLAERVARAEQQLKELSEHGHERGNRRWLIGAGLLTGLICPVLVTTFLTILHLRAG